MVHAAIGGCLDDPAAVGVLAAEARPGHVRLHQPHGRPPPLLGRARRASPHRRGALDSGARGMAAVEGRRGKKLTEIGATVAAGLPGLRIHDLRHTAVALWIAAGASPKEVAQRAGHTSVSFVLDRYGHLFPESDAALRERLDVLFRQATEHGRNTAG